MGDRSTLKQTKQIGEQMGDVDWNISLKMEDLPNVTQMLTQMRGALAAPQQGGVGIVMITANALLVKTIGRPLLLQLEFQLVTDIVLAITLVVIMTIDMSYLLMGRATYRTALASSMAELLTIEEPSPQQQVILMILSILEEPKQLVKEL